MKIKIIENTNRIILESDVNSFIKDKKVFNIQYSQTYIYYSKTYTLRYEILRTAMIIYELEGEE